MIVTIDNNFTEYHYNKNCILRLRKFFRNSVDDVLFEYGLTGDLVPRFSCWSTELPRYYQLLVMQAYNYIGFDRNYEESDVRSLVSQIRRYLIRKACKIHEKDK